MKPKTKQGHTPGPWIVSDYGGACIQTDKSRYAAKTICNLAHYRGKMNEEETANGNLIAAAPELLKAAKNIISLLGHEYALVELQEAIAKAEGRS